MDDESYNMSIPLIVTGTVVASTAIGLTCYYFKKWQNSKTAGILGHNNEKIPLNILENNHEEEAFNPSAHNNNAVQELTFSGSNRMLSIIYEEPELDLSGNYDHIIDIAA